MKKDPFAPIIMSPETGDATATVIWLHGLGANGYDFLPILPELSDTVTDTVRFVFPHAPQRPVTINGGMVMHAWYDIDFNNTTDKAGIQASQQTVHELIQAQIDQGIPTERIVLAGFSQGGAIVQYTGLRYPHKLAGILALSTYLPLADELAAERHPDNQNIPIFIAHGLQDPLITTARAEQSRDKLQQLGYTPKWQTYMMEHAVCGEEIEDIDVWLKTILNL